MSIAEIIAVALALVYVIFAVKENSWCWYAAFVSVTIYIFICYQSKLYHETFLQVFYLIMAVYGYLQWKKKDKKNETDTLQISTWSNKLLLYTIITSAFVSIIVGYLFATYTSASMPYLDAPITIFSLLATYMVTKKIIQNWIFWVLIDLASIFLYAARGLNLTAGLYGLYVIIALIGYFEWKKKLTV